MTEEEIDKIAQQRIDAEKSSNKSIDVDKEASRRILNSAPKPKEVPKPSREEWLSYNPGGDYDTAMKERDAKPLDVASDSSDYDSIQAKLRAAQQEIEDEKAKQSLGDSTLDLAKSVYNEIPEKARPYALGAAGYQAGKVLRSALPQEMVMGTPEYRDVQKERQSMLESREPLQNEAKIAINANINAEDEHLNRMQELAKQAKFAQYQNELHQQQLRDAQLAHANAQTLNFEDELARRTGTNRPMLSNAPELTPASRGGEGASNYALKFGATEEEARRVPSMSVMQQQNIPAQQEAWNKIPKIAPTFEAIKESPLILGTEGQKAVRERLANEMQAEQQRKAQVDAEHQRIKEEIARQKAQTQIALENAREQAKQSAKAAAEAAKAHAEHKASSAVSPSQTTTAQTLEQAYSDLQEKIKKTNPSLLAKIGQIGGRFVPGLGAAFAPIQAAKAKEYYDKGELMKAGVYGLGSLGALAQATGIPPLVGAGDLLQLPSAGLSLYELANEKPNQ
jgi:hypothetical protein